MVLAQRTIRAAGIATTAIAFGGSPGLAGQVASEPEPSPRLSQLDPRTWTEWLLPIDSMGSSPQPQAAACRLYVREVGEGSHVVLLHGGWGGDLSDLFYGLLPLAETARVVAYDQRGSLRSRCDELPTVHDHVADLESLRIALEQDRLILIGHSMGTRLAMLYASAHPDRVAGLALVSPTWPTHDAPQVERSAQPWEAPEVAEELGRHGLALERRLEDGPRGWSINHRIIFASVNLADATRWRETRPPWAYDQEVATHTARSMPAAFDFRPVLAALGVPILVLQGDRDYLPPATWAAEIPAVRRVVVENAGHNAYTDRPDVVLEELREFIAASRR